MSGPEDLASFERCAEMVRRMKRELTARWREGDPESKADLVPFVTALRGGRLVGNVYPAGGNEGAREAAYIAALFLRADEVFVLSDSLMRSMGEGEVDERAMRAGALGEAWASGRRQGMTECILAVRIAPEGVQAMQHLPYVRHGNRIEWGEVITGIDRTEGAVIDYAQAGFAKARESWPSLESAIDSGLDAVEDREATTDRACAQFVSERFGCVVLLLEDEPRVYAEGREAPELIASIPH